MREDELSVGMAVVDADGKRLGKVTRLEAWGFEVERGFFQPREWVVRWDEVMSIRPGEVEVARSDDALFELAAGRLPSYWRRSPYSTELHGSSQPG